MRTLVFQIDCPWPTISGADIRNNMIVQAAKTAGEVLSVGLSTAPLNFEREENYLIVPRFKCLNTFNCMDPNVPIQLVFEQEDLDYVTTVAEHFRPDLILLEGVALSGLFETLQKLNAPIILDMHNIESSIYSSLLDIRPSGSDSEAPHHFSGRKQSTSELDRIFSKQVDKVWVCSETDRQLLCDIGGANATVVPNPVPDDRLFCIPISASRYAHPSTVFCGHLSYKPNVQAIRELVKNVGPALRKRKIFTRPTIAGRSPSKIVERYSERKNIVLISNPGSMFEILSQNGFSIMPITLGSGTRIKVLEALAAGIVVISPLKTVEGLCLVDGKHYVRAETAEAMANAIETMIKNPKLAVKIAENARRIALEKFSQQSLFGVVRKELQGLAHSNL